MPRTPIRPDRAAADRQACRSLQDRHCRGEPARTQLPSQAGDVLKGLHREASRNVQGRRYVSVRRRHCDLEAEATALHPEAIELPASAPFTPQGMIDVSGLRFADSAAIALLLLVARTLKGQGGGMVLIRPQGSDPRRPRPDNHDPGKDAAYAKVGRRQRGGSPGLGDKNDR